MKKSIFSLLVAAIIGCFMAKAQEIKPIKAVADDYIPLLENAGYMVFPFDISSLSDQTYQIIFKVQEYDHNSLDNDNYMSNFPLVFPNMMRVDQFSKEDQAKISREDMADPDRGIYTLAKKFQIGMMPVTNDSIRPLQIEVENIGGMSIALNLKPQYSDNDSINGKKLYNYHSRPFKVETMKMNTFIPLVLLGSVWYDEQFNLFRFCGESMINQDMSAQILKYIPHYYIIGVEINPVSE